jgi:hypothetical protein
MGKIVRFLFILLITTIPASSMITMPVIYIGFAMLYIINYPNVDDKIWIAFIVTVPAIINSIGTFLLHSKVEKVSSKVDGVGNKVEVVKEEMNGNMTKLLLVTGQSEKAKGVLEGTTSEKAKQHDRDLVIKDNEKTT